MVCSSARIHIDGTPHIPRSLNVSFGAFFSLTREYTTHTCSGLHAYLNTFPLNEALHSVKGGLGLLFRRCRNFCMGCRPGLKGQHMDSCMNESCHSQGSHTIILLQYTKAAQTRTFYDYKTVALASEGEHCSMHIPLCRKATIY